jgi:hypothetical protein
MLTTGGIMQKCSMMALGIALSFGSMARAGTPLTPQTLGMVNGILSYCADIDRPDAALYQALLQSVTGGTSDRSADAAQGSAAYRQSFDEVRDVLSKMPRSSAIALCKTSIK